MAINRLRSVDRETLGITAHRGIGTVALHGVQFPEAGELINAYAARQLVAGITETPYIDFSKKAHGVIAGNQGLYIICWSGAWSAISADTVEPCVLFRWY
jgi:hypothetical protein